MFLEVPQIQFNNRVLDVPVVCRDGYAQRETVQNTVETSQVQDMVYGPLNRSDQLQQFTFVVGVPVQIPAEFSQAQVVGTLLAQRLVRQWIHALRQFLGAFGRASLFST